MSAVDARSFGKLFRGIEAQMRVAYGAAGSKVFWPEQFAKDQSQLEDILRAFKKLSEDGRVLIVVDVICGGGHRLRSIPPEETEDVISGMMDHCPRCEESSDSEVYTQLRAELTPEWEDELREEMSSLQKKRNRGGLN